MEMQIRRPTTSQEVLGRSSLFLPEDHPLLQTMDQSFTTFGVQGQVMAPSDGPSLYQLELLVPISNLEGDALVSSLMSDRADSPILDEAEVVFLLDN